MRHRSAEFIVQIASLFVPRDRRSEWVEEWRAELAALREGADAGASGLLLAAASVAAWLPARRASRVDAAISLRD